VTADLETRRRKLAFRASRRGFRELDLDLPDQHVFDWIMGQAEPPQNHRSEVLDLLLSFRYSPPT
jgi:antitoxin CptB